MTLFYPDLFSRVRTLFVKKSVLICIILSELLLCLRFLLISLCYQSFEQQRRTCHTAVRRLYFATGRIVPGNFFYLILRIHFLSIYTYRLVIKVRSDLFPKCFSVSLKQFALIDDRLLLTKNVPLAAERCSWMLLSYLEHLLQLRFCNCFVDESATTLLDVLSCSIWLTSPMITWPSTLATTSLIALYIFSAATEPACALSANFTYYRSFRASAILYQMLLPGFLCQCIPEVH